MLVGDDQYWRCMLGMTVVADAMCEKGYSDPENGDRFWCHTCLDWVVAHVTEDDRAICHGCLSEVITPNQVKEYMEDHDQT